MDVGGVGGDPAGARQVELSPAMLVLGDVISVHANAEELAGGHTHGAAETHERGVDVGALAGPGGQQRTDVTLAAALDALVTHHVLDDPLVDGLGLVEVGGLVAHDLVGGIDDLLVDGHHGGTLEVGPHVLGNVALLVQGGAHSLVARGMEGERAGARGGVRIGAPLHEEHLVAFGVGVDLCRGSAGRVVAHVRDLLVLGVLGDRKPQAHNLARRFGGKVDGGGDGPLGGISRRLALARDPRVVRARGARGVRAPVAAGGRGRDDDGRGTHEAEQPQRVPSGDVPHVSLLTLVCTTPTACGGAH